MVHKLRMVFVFFNDFISTYTIASWPTKPEIFTLWAYTENVCRPQPYKKAATDGSGGRGESTRNKYQPPRYLVLFSPFLNWSIADLQCCISFSCIAKWFHSIYFFLFQILFHYGLLQNTEYSSLCYMVGSLLVICSISSIFSIVYMLILNSWFIPPPPSPLW